MSFESTVEESIFILDEGINLTNHRPLRISKKLELSKVGEINFSKIL